MMEVEPEPLEDPCQGGEDISEKDPALECRSEGTPPKFEGRGRLCSGKNLDLLRGHQVAQIKVVEVSAAKVERDWPMEEVLGGFVLGKAAKFRPQVWAQSCGAGCATCPQTTRIW